MKRKVLPLIVLILVLYLISLVGSFIDGEIKFNWKIIMFTIVIIFLTILTSLLYLKMFPKIKFRKIYTSISKANYVEAIKDIKNLQLSNSIIDQIFIISIIPILIDEKQYDLFIEIIKNITNKNLVSSKYFWLTVYYYIINNHDKVLETFDDFLKLKNYNKKQLVILNFIIKRQTPLQKERKYLNSIKCKILKEIINAKK